MDEKLAAIAGLIAMRLEQGWDSQADRLYKRAIDMGFKAQEVELAVDEAAYNRKPEKR